MLPRLGQWHVPYMVGMTGALEMGLLLRTLLVAGGCTEALSDPRRIW